MPARPISSKLHGLLDVATGATLIASAPALGLAGARAGRILAGAGAATLGTAVCTDSEPGLVRVIPYKMHLALDAVVAIGLAASPWILGTPRRGPRQWLPHLAFGLVELGATALSDPSGRGARMPSAAIGGGGEGAQAQAGERRLHHPSQLPRVYPEGSDRRFSRGAVGGRRSRYGGIGSGTGPGSDPPVGGLQG